MVRTKEDNASLLDLRFMIATRIKHAVATLFSPFPPSNGCHISLP